MVFGGSDGGGTVLEVVVVLVVLSGLHLVIWFPARHRGPIGA